jgi:glycosyltransferase involved in cell wall biosynthesis
MIEAFACGTPVIAYRRGSVPEVMSVGKTGWIVNGVQGAVAALKRLNGGIRQDCRKVFEERFTAKRMADDYLRIYQQLVKPKTYPKIVAA